MIEFSKFIIDYLEQINKKVLTAEWLKDKYIYFICVLFTCYSKALSLNSQKQEDKSFIDSIQEKVIFYFNIVKEFNMKALRGMAEIFKNQKNFFHFLLLKIMRIHLNNGIKFLDKKELKFAKIQFEDTLMFANKNKLIECNFEGELKEDYNDIIDSCKFNIKRIKAQILMDEAETNLKNAIENSEDINIYLVNLALDQYKNAYKIISRDYNNINVKKKFPKFQISELKYNLFYDLESNNNISKKGTSISNDNINYDESEEEINNEYNGNSCIDIEYEAICLANIIKIKYEILKNKSNLTKLLNDANKSIQLGESLSPKNVSSEPWFINIRKLQFEIQKEIDLMEEKEVSQKLEQVKNECKSILDEIEENSKKTNIEFIKYILSKHPYEGYVPIENIEDKVKNDLVNFLTDLKKHYNEQNFNPKSNDEDELKKYVIAEKISKHLNQIILCFEKDERRVNLKKIENEKEEEDEY